MVAAKSEIVRLERLADIGSGRDQPILLDKNERTVSYSQEHFQEILNSFDSSDLNRYPDQSMVYEKLSEFLEVGKGNILLTSGADSGLKHIFQVFVEKNDRVVSVDPTYAMISVYAQMFEAEMLTVGYDKTLTLDEQGLLKGIEGGAKVVVIPNPNQPTGTMIAPALLETLLELSQTKDFLLVIDEAYIEFSDAQSLIYRVDKYPNLCVLRTFSKAWGLAGARLGYIVSSAYVLEQVRKVKPLLDINILSIKAVCFLLDRYHLVQDYIERVREGRTYLEQELGRLGIDCISGFANFVHVRLPEECSPEDVERRLCNQGFRVRVAGGTASVLDGCIRATVGPKEQMTDFVSRLVAILGRR